MRFSHFFIDRPIFAVGPVDHHPDRGLHRPARPADGGVSRDRPAHGQRHRDLSRRLGRGHRRDRRHAARARDQRRRRHALHQLAVDRRRTAVDQRRVQARHRHRPGPGQRAEPGRRRPAAPARGRAAARHRGAQGLARPDDGRAHDLARRQPRPAIHLQLRHALREGRAGPGRRRRQRAGVRRARLFDAHLARPGARGRPQPDGGRGHAGAARRQPAGRRRRDQPGAGRLARRLHAVGADAGPADLARGVRQHRAARRDRRLGHAPARRGAHRARRAGLYGERLSRQQERHGARHLPAARLQRAGHRPPA